MPKPNVALMGLGLMGSGMARNLLAAGFPLTVYNRTPEKAAPLADAGARVATSPRDAAAGAEIVISMVSDDAASRAVWLGDDGALAGAEPGALLIESSTVTAEWVRELAGRAAERGFELLDAPVTGSKPQAAEGKLLFLVGGSESALERARPVLAAMSRDIVHIGPTGSGALIKLVNNFLCGVQAASLAEALALIDATGLDRGRALEVLTGGAPGSPMVKTLADRMAARDFSTRFALRLMLKDLDYAFGEGARSGVPLRTAASARDVFESSVAAGDGEKDLSAVVEQFRER
jgi:3-hydroxyisobutyrate dehydrogenase